MRISLDFYAELNLGDDLFVRILLERYPNIKFITNTRFEYTHVFNEYENFINEEKQQPHTLNKYYKKGYNYLLRKLIPSKYSAIIKKRVIRKNKNIINKMDGFVIIGGSIFMQPTIHPAYEKIEYYKFISHKPLFFLGCNFGPYTDPKYKKGYEEVFKNAADVCFRDTASKKLFKNIKTVRNAPDIVFGMKNIIRTRKRKKSVGFSIIAPRGKTNKKKYEKQFTDLIKFYIKQSYDVFLFSFCTKQEDLKTIGKISKNIKDKSKLSIIEYNGDIDGFLQIYSSVEKMYCGRFHAMILSMLYRQKFYPIVYSEKMTNVLNDIDFKGAYTWIEYFYDKSPENLDEALNKVQYNIDKQIEKTNEQFQVLDYFLNN